MRSGADIWVCGKCRSINPLSSGKCYRCHTPIEVAAAKPEDLTVEHKEVAPEPTGVFQSSETRAVIASIATVAFILATFVALWINRTAVDLRSSGEAAAASELLLSQLPILALAPILAVVALASYGAWIMRVVENMPALGVGYSRVTPTFAFFEPLIPGFNIYAIPARMGEAILKLGGNEVAMPLLGLAIIVALGPAVAAGFLLRFTRLFGTGEELRQAISIGLIVVFVCQAIALLIGLFVLWQIEGMARKKHEALAGGPPQPSLDA